jgi:hypothetical protein
MHGQDLPAGALEGDASPEECRDRRDEGCGPAAVERPSLELGLQQAGLAFHLGPASHDEPDHGPFEGSRIRPPEPEPGYAVVYQELAERLEALRGDLALDQQDPGDAGRYEGIRQRAELIGAGGDEREGPGRDDREVAGIERVEGGHSRLQDPDPGDRPGLGRRGANRASRRKELGLELGQLRHAGPAALGKAAFSARVTGSPRTRTRSSTSAPSSRSKSSCRSARPTTSRRPSVRNRAQIRRRGK